jgi:hypothetical protein
MSVSSRSSASPARLPSGSNIWPVSLRVGIVLSSLCFLTLAITVVQTYFVKDICSSGKKSWDCFTCPEHGHCTGGSPEFQCEPGYFPFFRICAKPGNASFLFPYNKSSTLYYEIQRRIYQYVIGHRQATLKDVKEAFQNGPDPLLRRLDEIDIQNIWMYEGENYYIDDRGVLVPSPKRAKPGFGLFSILVSSAVLIFAVFFVQ